MILEIKHPLTNETTKFEIDDNTPPEEIQSLIKLYTPRINTLKENIIENVAKPNIQKIQTFMVDKFVEMSIKNLNAFPLKEKLKKYLFDLAGIDIIFNDLVSLKSTFEQITPPQEFEPFISKEIFEKWSKEL